MAHEIETTAWTNEVPWHGLGTRVDHAPSVAKMIKAAKLDWTVEKRVMQLETGDDVPNFFALVRDKDDRVLDVVGRRYVPIQNREAFEFFVEFVEAGDATMETAGSLHGGQYVWGLANLGSSFKLANNDVVKGYLLVACPHQQGKSLIIKFTTVRVVCNNTLTLALRSDDRQRGTEVRFTHRRTFDKDAVMEAKEALGIARDQMKDFEATAKKLKKTKMDLDDATQVIARVFDPSWKKGDDTSRPVSAILSAYDNAPGADPGTAWGVLQAVTYYADHMASRTTDKRLSNAWFGTMASKKEKILELLTV